MSKSVPKRPDPRVSNACEPDDVYVAAICPMCGKYPGGDGRQTCQYCGKTVFAEGKWHNKTKRKWWQL